MIKKFDIKSKGQTTFWKQLRIHPCFLWWKYQIKIFVTFLSVIFFLSIAFSIVFKTHNFIMFMQNNLNKISLNNAYNIDDVSSNINNLIKNLEPVLLDLKPKLAPAKYIKEQNTLVVLEELVGNLKAINATLPQIEIAKNDLIKSADAVYLLNYLHQNEPLIIKTTTNLQLLIKELGSLTIFSSKLTKYEPQLKQLSSYFKSTPTLINFLYTITGDKSPHRLVIWLQNANEKRATGGFIGAFLEIVINDGQIKTFNYHDIYDYDGQITEKITAPPLVKKLSTSQAWSLRDANYSPDFTKSAQAFMQLYEKAGGNTIDTIMAIDQSLIIEILRLTGGIEIPEYGLKLTADNFDLALSYIVEGKVNKDKPKNFIKETLLNKILLQVKEKLTLNDFIKLYNQQLGKIQVYSIHEEINLIADIFKFNLHLDKKIQDPKQLFINQISISGNKSDAFIEQKITMQEKRINDKKQVTIKIKRKHNWSSKQEKQWLWLFNNIKPINIPADELKRILGYGDNNTLFQIFLPAEYKNITTIPETFTINTWPDEDSKKIIAEFNAPLLKVGESQELEFSFFLPEKYLLNK